MKISQTTRKKVTFLIFDFSIIPKVLKVFEISILTNFQIVVKLSSNRKYNLTIVFSVFLDLEWKWRLFEFKIGFVINYRFKPISEF